MVIQMKRQSNNFLVQMKSYNQKPQSIMIFKKFKILLGTNVKFKITVLKRKKMLKNHSSFHLIFLVNDLLFLDLI